VAIWHEFATLDKRHRRHSISRRTGAVSRLSLPVQGCRRVCAASSIDVHVGARIRRRRTLLGMSQQDLGQALGITFQQVQKNERGENRVAASRLFSLSRVLDVPISFFFEDMPDSLTSTQRVDAQNARAGEGILPHHRSRGAQARVRPDQRDGVGRDLTIGDLAQARHR
jgi:transcriptional regulator with XRE-family HTH domain